MLGARTASGHLGDVIADTGENALVRLEKLQIETFVDLAYVAPVSFALATRQLLRFYSY
jgi:hypothetical protein